MASVGNHSKTVALLFPASDPVYSSATFSVVQEPAHSELLEAEEAEGAEHDVAPDQEDSGLGDAGQASDHHLDYIAKGSEE